MPGSGKTLPSLTGDLKIPTLVSILDMARWMAAAIVFIGHLRNPLFFAYPDVAPVDRNFAVQMWYFVTGLHAEAVVIFFVLSGLLVGGAGWDRLNLSRFRLPDYSIDRVSRLYIAFLPALLLGYLLDVAGTRLFPEIGFWTHTHPMIAQKISTAPFVSMMSFDTLLGNIFMLQTFIVEPLGSNQPLWSISAEFWFYFVFGVVALLRITALIRVRLLGILILVIIPLLLGMGFLPLFGLWLMGTIIIFIPPRLAPRPLVAFCIFCGTLFFARYYHNLFSTDALLLILKNYVTAFTFAVLIVSLRGRKYRILDRMSSLNKLFASFSYSLYLIHFPLMLFLLAALHATGYFPTISEGFVPNNVQGILIYIFVILLVYLLAWLFSRFTEAKTGQLRTFIKESLQYWDAISYRPSTPSIDVTPICVSDISQAKLQFDEVTSGTDCDTSDKNISKAKAQRIQ